MSAIESSNANGLIQAWKALRESQPRLRMRDIASHLNTSEAGLLAAAEITQAQEFPKATSLRENWGDLFAKLGSLGRVMVLTRNEACVHERKGRFEEVSSGPGNILVVGPDIDLRLFPGVWKFGFAVEEAKQDGFQRSLQIFDEKGDAVHKIFLTDGSDVQAWEDLKSEFTKKDPILDPLFVPKEETPSSLSKKEISPEAKEQFLSDWGKLEDTHEFFPLLRKYGVSRIQSMELAEGIFTQRIDARLVLRMLELASLNRTPIMVFVGNHGAIQIHTGEVTNIKVLEHWWNVLDPEFNLHLRSDLISSSWIVEKPSKDGKIHSIEVYDEKGELIVQFFGKRKPGQAERTDWLGILDQISPSVSA
ncbi:hemin-degrading factor [Leptospira langatensis]|uniref:Hemin-degrading factor n=1 Tax=Leptospira langatensis TaxID=2484983 RepID=A0A5F1ZS12_9LEPT|nr:ChuX/HutX family heme-like substrate-binding protein [Leptospira langatensis]TGJ98853.1 hemin-degrading factor [Leptospira langatensis]TGL40581.1 hemin-degrading factor [Leptospira langatensis]